MVKVEITNLPEFLASMKKLEAQILENIEEALEDSANNLVEKARERVPVKTGDLRDSIKVQKGEGDLNYLVQASAPHARFIEFGSLKTPARPFLGPAVEESRDGIRETMIKAINAAIRG